MFRTRHDTTDQVMFLRGLTRRGSSQIILGDIRADMPNSYDASPDFTKSSKCWCC